MASAAISALRADRDELLDIADHLTDADWKSESGCPGWSVQDVVTHLGTLYWLVVDPTVLPETGGAPTEEAQERAVESRRTWSSESVVEDYAAVERAGARPHGRARDPRLRTAARRPRHVSRLQVGERVRVRPLHPHSRGPVPAPRAARRSCARVRRAAPRARSTGSRLRRRNRTPRCSRRSRVRSRSSFSGASGAHDLASVPATSSSACSATPTTSCCGPRNGRAWPDVAQVTGPVDAVRPRVACTCSDPGIHVLGIPPSRPGFAHAMAELNLTADQLLSTTRTVRKHLDLTRPVEREVLDECHDLAFRPSGGNAQGWHFVIVADAERGSEPSAICTGSRRPRTIPRKRRPSTNGAWIRLPRTSPSTCTKYRC